MNETKHGFEPAIRLTASLGVLAGMALWEIAAPRRRRNIPRVIRWTNNLALVVIDTAILRLTFPIPAVGLAVLAEERGWGLFNALDIPVWIAVVALPFNLRRGGVDKTWGSCGAFSVCDGQPTIENCGPCDGYSVSPFGRPPHPSALSHAGIGNVID